MSTLLKLFRSFDHGLKIGMRFGYYPQIICVTFSQVKLSGVIKFNVNR